ncbi:MAG: ferredoxin--NADP reductase [Candidatus Nanoarchaeia archaeon]
MKPTKFGSTLLETKDLTPTVFLLAFSVPDDFSFEPGQYVSIAIPVEGNVRRSYSIASGPDKKRRIELCIKRVEHGVGSNFLHGLKPGDSVEMLGPLGNFKIKDKSKDLIFIATGSGIAPFRSMIPTVKGKVILLSGVRYEDEVLFADEWTALEKERDFKHHQIISRPRDPDYSGEKGHVQQLFKHIPEGFNGHFYLCGLWLMIEESVKALEEKGFRKEQIFYERYS